MPAMTTATTSTAGRSLAAVPDDTDGLADIKRTSYQLTVHTRYRGRLTTSKLDFAALALLDGGSMLNLVGGATDEQARALRAMLFRVTVDDDGIGRDVEIRSLRDDQVSYAWLDDEPDTDDDPQDDDGPAAIPADAALTKLRKSALVELAERYDLDTDGTNPDLIARLAEHREELAGDEPGSDLAVADHDVLDGVLEDEPAVWRLVWPRHPDAGPDDPWELAVDATFPTQRDATVHAADHGSSLRRFGIVLLDPDSIIAPESLNNAVGAVAEAATGRPTGPSKGFAALAAASGPTGAYVRGALTLAGVRPAELPADVVMDAEWAALVQMMGPGEHVTDVWADLTGDDLPAVSAESYGDDNDAVAALNDLDDETLARMVPAYAKALERGDEHELAELDRQWAMTAKFAGGQEALAAFARGGQSRKRSTTPKAGGGGKATPKAPASAPAAPVPAPSGFGMPPGMGG